MKVEYMVLGGVATNCWFLINEETKETLIADPADRAEEIIKKASDEGLKIRAVLLTHGHGDHIMAVPGLRKSLNVPVYANRLEEELLSSPGLNLSTSLFGRPLAIEADVLLDDGDVVSEAGLSFKMLSTPGHTPGGCCYYNAAEGVLLSGDTLFCGSVGRTDFPGGSMSRLIRSISEKLMCLPDETLVCPGHGETTSIGFERANNPYLAGIY